jgi:hypothetical protein
MVAVREKHRMHTVELLDAALRLASQAGYRHRQDWLGSEPGCLPGQATNNGAGGVCQFAGQKWLFLDLGHSPGEQLDVVLDALRDDPAVATIDVPPVLAPYLNRRKSA